MTSSALDIDISKISIGDFFQLNERNAPGGTVELIDILPANVEPLSSKIFKYYGDFPPRISFRRLSVNRYVFRRTDSENKNYIVPEGLLGEFVRPITYHQGSNERFA
jgi:hypothetical protein